MTKQLESRIPHIQQSTKNLIFFICLSISISLQDTLSQVPGPNTSKTSQQAPTNLALNNLVPGPYTYEGRINKLQNELIYICAKLRPRKKVQLNQILSSPTETQNIRGANGIPYNEFVAWRTITDQKWKEQKEDFINHTKNLGYTTAQMYSIYQIVSFLSQEWGNEYITIIDSDLFFQISHMQKTYPISGKEGISTYIQSKQPNQGATAPSSIKKSEERNPTYRMQPTHQTTIYGKTTINMIHYDWNTASRKLHDIGYKFWSSTLQEQENGQHYLSGFSCLEGITQDALDGLQTLYTTLQKINNGKPIYLYINGGTEGYDHRMGNSIIAGHSTPGINLTPEHSRAHGAGYTVDIRLSGDAALLLKKIFQNERGKTIIGNTVYEYLFHGNGTGYHLHLNIFSQNTYSKLFATTNKD